jgi:uncharacterized membrane protein
MSGWAQVFTKGFKGHPLHPPLTDASIGAYTVATAAAVGGWAGLAPSLLSPTAFVAVVLGLVFTVPTVVTGLIDFLDFPSEVAAKRTAWVHLAVMATATVLFLVSAFLLYPDRHEEVVPDAAALVILIGFVVLTVGGWVGGSLAYVHGVRVLGQPDTPTSHAVRPIPPGDNSDGS